MKYKLAICIPTYNRREVLISDINRYLSIFDNRFCVKVQDNHSTDGTTLALTEIHDNRLFWKENTENVGPRINCWKALQDSDSEYVLLLLDKDTIDIEQLPLFLDYLDHDCPKFGYISLLNHRKEISTSVFEAGFESVRNTAFLSKHPSGYFWKKTILDDELRKPYFKEIPADYDFPFEIVNAYIGTMYASQVVNLPLIVTVNERSDYQQGKTYTYFGSNLFFGKERRLQTYRLYITTLLELKLSRCNIIEFSYSLTLRVAHEVTDELRKIYHNPLYLDHYSLVETEISRVVLFRNLCCVVKLYVCLMWRFQGHISLLFNALKVMIKGLVWICR